jgi:hypothetical protein
MLNIRFTGGLGLCIEGSIIWAEEYWNLGGDEEVAAKEH